MASEIVVKFLGDPRDLHNAFRSVGASAGAMEQNAKRSFAGIAHGAQIASAVILGGLVVAGKVAIDRLGEMATTSAKTQAVIESTGGVAGVSAQHVDDLANSLLKKSGVDNEVIKSGENMLLTFTNIRNQVGEGKDIFDQATKAALDLSVGFGTSMHGAALKLGKALEDPIRGLSGLTRMGVMFTAAQREQIKALVDSGHAFDAQKIILDAVSTKYGGMAETVGGTFPQRLNLAKVELKNMAASVMEAVLPALTIFAETLSKLAGFLTDHETFVKAVVVALTALTAGVLAVSAAQQAWKAIQTAITVAVRLFNVALAANPIMLVVAALVLLVAGLIEAWEHSATFRRIVHEAFAAVKAVVQDVVDFVKEDLPAAFRHVIDWLKSHWKEIATVIAGPFAPIVALATNAFGVRSALEGAFQHVLDWLKDHWREIVSIITAPFAGPFVALATNAFGIRSALTGAFQDVKDWLGSAWHTVIGQIKYPFLAILGAAEGAFGIRGALEGAFWGIVHFLHALADDVLGGATAIGSALYHGIVSGVVGLGSRLIELVVSPLNSIIRRWNNLSIPGFTLPSINIPFIGKVGGQTLGPWQLPDIPELAFGGIVTSPRLALVGEAGPEAIIPLGRRGIGDTYIHIEVHGSVIRERDLVESIRSELLRIKKRNVGLGMA